MRKQFSWSIVCVITVTVAFLCTWLFSRSVTAMAEKLTILSKPIIVIDPGHGVPDGGAVSCTGQSESVYNLEIAVRLRDFMQLLGFRTKMVRTSESSIYTEGTTIAAKKMSDLKERVRIINETPGAVLLSIHQNYFQDSRYSGAVVLYANTEGSRALAESLQGALVQSLNPGSKRQCKRADGVYLMKHITCPGVLIECGFLSNPQEEYNLRSPEYQKKLSAVIGCTVSGFLCEQKTLDSNISQ